ncbi:MAG: gamma-glutamylcyclotransferase family protein [Acidobacteriota bacterium]
MTDSLFVYGTLRMGGSREIARLFPSSVFLDFAKVWGTLHDLGAYPGLELTAGGASVLGEVYAVSGEVLKALDEIEGFYPSDPASSYFLRKKTKVLQLSGSRRDCWIYECNADRFALEHPIPSGDWIEYARRKEDAPADEWPT